MKPLSMVLPPRILIRAADLRRTYARLDPAWGHALLWIAAAGLTLAYLLAAAWIAGEGK